MIGWLDPSLGSANAGDDIIAEAVSGELERLGATDVVRLSTRRRWSRAELRAAARCGLFIVGGTNLLASHPWSYRQWRVGVAEAAVMRRRVVLFGVGWWQYQPTPDATARLMLRALLDPTLPHSVRDGYTQRQLGRIRVPVINTSCPTLWRVPLRGTVRGGFRSTVVTTVTDYYPDVAADSVMLETIQRRARDVVVWPQGGSDLEYLRQLGFGGRVLPPRLEAFDDILRAPGAEYVGTRLHAGIRALQRGVPAAVVAVDNRAAEISRDVGLWTLPRDQIGHLDSRLDGWSEWSLALPHLDIERWRDSLRHAIARR